MALDLRYNIKIVLTITYYKSSQFSHKQLVLVTAPVSTGAIFFITLIPCDIVS